LLFIPKTPKPQNPQTPLISNIIINLSTMNSFFYGTSDENAPNPSYSGQQQNSGPSFGGFGQGNKQQANKPGGLGGITGFDSTFGA
jgi:hypothetical protein